MVSLEPTLSWLDLSQYLETFLQAGFDTWETLMEITEDDLDSLNVELGHRRKLQREIAKTRVQAQPSILAARSYPDKPNGGPHPTLSMTRREPLKQDSQPTASSKRGYRHHPKADENTPQRPYSAYVMFSNWLREEKKDEGIAFAEMSKQVGENWQALSLEGKEKWKQKAATPWEKYKQDLAEYQKTDNYRKYTQYVTDFNAAQATKRGKGAYSPTTFNASQSSQAQVPNGLDTALSQRALGHTLSSQNANTPNATNGAGVHGMERNDLRRLETGVPIPRITWASANGAAAGESAGSRALRVNQACEPCRQKKSKCDGERPNCKHCRNMKTACFYQDGKKDKGRK